MRDGAKEQIEIALGCRRVAESQKKFRSYLRQSHEKKPKPKKISDFEKFSALPTPIHTARLLDDSLDQSESPKFVRKSTDWKRLDLSSISSPRNQSETFRSLSQSESSSFRSENDQSEIESLPSELILKILSNIPTNQIVQTTSLLNSNFFEYSNSSALWRHVQLNSITLPVKIIKNLINIRPISISFTNVNFSMVTSSKLKDLFSSSRLTLKGVTFKNCTNVNLGNILLFILTKNVKNLTKLILIGQSNRANQKSQSEPRTLGADFKLLSDCLNNLRVLKLNDDSIDSHYFFKFLKSNPNLKNLTLKGLHRLKPIPFIESLESLYELKKLNLTSCYQMTQIGTILTKFSSTLTSLKLKNVQISVHTLPAILQCKNLEILNLSNSLSRSNEVKFEEKEFINDLCSSLFKLRKLNLNHSMVTSDWLKSISQLESLSELGLRDTQIENLEFLFFSKNLKILDLSNCSIPEMVKNLTFLLSKLIKIQKIGLNGFEQLVKDTAMSFHVGAL